MSIYKKSYKKGYMKLGKEIFKKDLSPKTLLALIIFLSKPEDWGISKQYLINNHKFTRRDTDFVFKELEEKGHLVVKRGKRTKENPSGISYDVYEWSIFCNV